MTFFRSNIAHPASVVAFGASRAVTGYLRRHYRRRYRGHMRHPRLTFIFDAALLAIAMMLIGFSLWITTRPLPEPAIRVTLSTPPVVSGAPVPFTLTFQSTDDLIHQSVRVRWHLPAGAEILAADPPIALDGSSFIGIVSPEEPVIAHVVVRVLVPEGDHAVFGVSVTYDSDDRNVFFGEGVRLVERSALTATVPDAFRVEQVAQEGAIIPIRVENTTEYAMPFVYVRIKDQPTASEERMVALGNLDPFEVRWVYVSVPPPLASDTSSNAVISWNVGTASRDLSAGSWQAAYASDATTFPEIVGDFSMQTGIPTTLTLSSTAQSPDLLVMHPLLPDPVARVTPSRNGTITLPTVTTDETPNHEWFIAPLIESTLGPAMIGTIEAELPLMTQVRYRASTGDQLGAGPLPPRVGLETRYWVFWTAGPVDSSLATINVRTTLPPGVSATGKVTLPDGGTYTTIGRTVSWSLPTLGIDRARALFGFEIAATPDKSDIGSPLMLIATSTASANDTHSSLRFTAENAPIFSTLGEFESALGIVTQ